MPQMAMGLGKYADGPKITLDLHKQIKENRFK